MWQNINEIQENSILLINKNFLQDPSEFKLNLTIGCTKEVLPIVSQVEYEFAKEEYNNPNKVYLDMEGYPGLIEQLQKLVFGDYLPQIQSQLCSIQTFSGIGALKIAFDFVNQQLGVKNIYTSDPSWGFYYALAPNCHLQILEYPYYDRKNKCLKFQEIINKIQSLKQTDSIILQCGSHNPTGIDPTMEQWIQIVDAIQKSGVITILDLAYQGFGEGCNLENDIQCIKIFIQKKIPFLLAECCGKKFTFYGELVGALHIYCPSQEIKGNIESQIKHLSCMNTGGPSIHGAAVITKILKSTEYKQKWINQLKEFSCKFKKLKLSLYDNLTKLNSKLNWEHLKYINGFYVLLDVNKEQIKEFRNTFHIYFCDDGRISLTGLQEKDVENLAMAIIQILG